MRLALPLAAVVGYLVALSGLARAEDFRIETKVYTVKENKLVSENTTLFRGGIVYDFLGEPPQIAVFDEQHGRFVLLDTARKLRTDISTQQLLVFCGQLRTWAMNGPKGYLQFCSNPQLAVKFDEGTSELTLSSEYMNYKLQTTKAKTADAARQMREFSDWYARLNSLTNPGGVLPFPRLTVNEQLLRRGLVATQVELTIAAQAQLGGSGVAVRSEHDVKWQLLEKDLKKISETGAQLVNFRKAEFGPFMGQPPASAGQAQAAK